MDQSLIPKFPRGTFVNFSNGSEWDGRYPMEVLGTHEGLGVRTVHVVDRDGEGKFLEEHLRTMTFSEFCWFYHPTAHHWMSGKTRGWMAVLIHVFTLILCLGIASTLGWWGVAPLVIPALYWWGAYMNFKGYWK